MVRGRIGFIVVPFDLKMPPCSVIPGSAGVPARTIVEFLEERGAAGRLSTEQYLGRVRQSEMIEEAGGAIAQSPAAVGDHDACRIVPAERGGNKLNCASLGAPVEGGFGTHG